ncbi:MAG: exodeoxyribonuclease VII large subunit, partial [Planctomycetes bacterium]|nr:exodeoxyribonuclease VII large subunit [Planctomycetota bacterium]
MKPKAQPKPRPFTVSEVMHQVRACLEDGFRPVFVRGEVANKSRPRSGHLYLTLRDGQSSLRIVAFASVVERSPLEFQDGDELHVWGRITAYPRSGDVQLVADRLEPAGAGAWREQKERLRKRFAAEGCFDPARKRPIPFLPRSIGIVTSPTGAAIRDVLSTLDRRFGGGLRIVVAPTKVNGLDAAPGIAEALRDLDRAGGCDVILLVRGGGSQEDLAAFDTEPVIRAVVNAKTPIVCGVGHETDVSLADLAADRRAPTPTGAAEVAVPVKRELQAILERLERRL